LELNKSELSGGLLWFADMNFLHFALFLFAICAATLLGVSYMYPAPLPPSAENLIYRKGVLAEGASKSLVLLSGLLVLIVLILWYVFR